MPKGLPLDNDSINQQPGRANNHTFIIRIWFDQMDIPGYEKVWRGLIVHVNDEKKIYFNDLDMIRSYIQEQTGIRRIRLFSWWTSLLARLRGSQS